MLETPVLKAKAARKGPQASQVHLVSLVIPAILEMPGILASREKRERKAPPQSRQGQALWSASRLST